jgi:hypothetical protein
MKRVSVIIDPITNVYYSAFYIKALQDRFGKRNVLFKSTPFHDLSQRVDNFNFVIVNNGFETKYSIHFDDPYTIKEELYDWCDVYGNVNTNLALTPEKFHAKLISLVPSFGIRLWDLPQTMLYALLNGVKVVGDTNIQKFFGKYKRHYQLRLPYDCYETREDSFCSKKYVFHLSTLWYSNAENKNDENVNLVRANFIRACKSIDSIDFEGGFSKTSTSTLNDLFSPLIYSDFIPFSVYLEKIKASILVFNTPAFWNCHGWKLGEFLCLGKAIISTALYNDLPAPLIHGVHIHYVNDDQESMREAILLIVNNYHYRTTLEIGARKYWEEYGTPDKSLMLLGV